jgi:hypothetical protein
MRFYYFSLFGTLLALTVSLFAAGAFWAIWRGALKHKISAWAFLLSLPIFLVLPWTEEFWIAYNFGQFCRKDAGVFGRKTIEVEGFYDDTHGWRADKLRESGYKFVEGRDQQTYWRHEFVGDEVRSTRIKGPTARYRYSWPDRNIAVGHKIYRQVEEIVDAKSGETVAKNVQFGRTAPWFFIGLGDPGMTCPDSRQKAGVLLYRQILKPMGSREGK